MASRFIDWLTNLTAKSTTIDGSEITHIGSSGLSQKATIQNILRYGKGATTPSEERLGDETTFAKVFRTLDGAIYLEKGPYTGGQVQGNARGAGAFDWQAVRTTALRVASGANAVAIGANCTAVGANSISIGDGCNASGIGATAIGSGCGATQNYAIALGFQAQADAQFSAAMGGAYARTTNTGQIALSGNKEFLGALGVLQANIQGLALNTPDATPAPLRTDTTVVSNRMVIPAMRACTVTGLVTAMSDATDGYKVKAWEIKCVITRDNSNNTRIVGTHVITELGADTEAASWAITSITADNTNESLAITVTGEAATNIRWQASLFYGQVGW